MVSFYIVYLVPVVMAVIAYFIIIYPNFSNRAKIVHKNNPVAKRYLLDHRYGLCRVIAGQRLSEESFKLTLETTDKHRYIAKFYYGEVMPVNEFDLAANDQGIVLLQTAQFKKSRNVVKTEPESPDTVRDLKNVITKLRADSRIVINNPDERIDKMSDIIVKLEQAKNRGKREVAAT